MIFLWNSEVRFNLIYKGCFSVLNLRYDLLFFESVHLIFPLIVKPFLKEYRWNQNIGKFLKIIACCDTI